MPECHMGVRVMRTAQVWIAGGLGLALAAAAAMPGGAATSAAAVTFRGQVLDQGGRPVKAALISAHDKATTLTTVVISDERGAFRLPHLVPGTYEIEVSKEGYEPASATQKLPVGNWRTAIKKLATIPVEQLRDEEIIKFMPDDDPQK